MTKDSIVAVLNLRKAIHIMGNFFTKYILNVLILSIIFLADFLIIAFVVYSLGLGTTSTQTSVEIVFKFIIFLLFMVVKGVYTTFVNAYLLGTITPPGES